ncbi:DegT/DnrJ/EryC1/StrS family aminotransferase [Hoeflea ulvae]|uniref:DegT/DnrJ/EryC1/StrS family aminotransferase n=1 Tax=Hoeflea ulvae TaxID=2983764 RepID=A0ABT3YAG0_9HYPH|nr:aminotransferase class I/II-fold pyridoxal phosphate-dependent enzyme [Hoeflea ulvae]MCY0092866.1 DegT/DnrJ/EryC1/StrS family aminotransferase [Hoeflea ulvae]
MTKPFAGDFTLQEGLDDSAIAAATRVLKSGRLHRYNTAPGELSEAAQLEQAYAQYQGAHYCLACASGGYAMTIALRASGLEPGEVVLTNGFTLAPVPGAIAAAGGKPLLVEITDNLVIDLDDLERKAKQSGARYLLLSNMRGHLVDMERLSGIVQRHGLILIEDCAHTMGAAWNGRKSGNFGLAGCFSTQTYKHLNSGEGGLLTSDDAEFMARAIILSGSYMLYQRHGATPSADVFERDPARDPQHVRTHGQSARRDPAAAAVAAGRQYRTLERPLPGG